MLHLEFNSVILENFRLKYKTVRVDTSINGTQEK